MDALPERLRNALKLVRSVGCITGAGISAESGVPTYRGKGGLYDDPVEGDQTIEALSGPTLRSDPDRTWRKVAELARQARAARPNAAHHALAEIEAKVERFVLLTQNVDGLHQQAGSCNIIDIHGDTFATLCMRCQRRDRIEDPSGIERAPTCEACGGVMRPDVVLFGEQLDMRKIGRLRREFYQPPPDLILVVGTSALFPYIAEPVVYARSMSRLTIEVNPEETVLSEVVDYGFRHPAGEVLPLIAAAIVG